MNQAFFVAHIALLTLGILCFLVSSGLALLYFVEQRQLKSKHLSGRNFFPLDSVDRQAGRLIRAGFTLLSLAILTGVYLAHFYWKQQNWATNPKMILSAVVWAWYALVLFLRRYRGLRGTKFLASMALGLALLSSVFLVTYLWS